MGNRLWTRVFGVTDRVTGGFSGGLRPARSGATIELVLPNGRVLRVSEAMRPEVLGRLAAALDV